MITLTLNTGEKIDVQPGETLLEISQKNSEILQDYKSPIVAAIVNNEPQDLLYQIKEPAEVEFIGLDNEIGSRIYENSLVFVLIKAVQEINPECSVLVEHSLSKGLYCEIKGQSLTVPLVRKIEKRMREIIEADEVIEKLIVSKEEALEIFKKEQQFNKAKMLQFFIGKEVEIYKCGGKHLFFDDCLVPSTGYLEKFSLKFHLPGLIIRYPLPEDPEKIPEYVPHPKLAKVFYEAERWAEIMEVGTVADLNKLIADNKISLLIKVAEALHEKKIANIADEITSHGDRGRIVLIAGPSSSGKTTFAQRLMIQLMANGLKPMSISLDDYFVDREKTPLDENGQYDFEALEAIDLELFNEHLASLTQGEAVEIPYFNFKKGKREYRGRVVRIEPYQPIIIEGIHGLNEKLTYSIPGDHKYKIYISCLTQLNLDDHNRIHTSDVRKIRRLVRDFKFRGNGAMKTLQMWSSVRRGEERNIFPYQEEADIIFNSSLVYELSVLKKYAEALLLAIGPENIEYPQAKRLLKLLSYITPLDSKEVPPNSILKEFIGSDN